MQLCFRSYLKKLFHILAVNVNSLTLTLRRNNGFWERWDLLKEKLVRDNSKCFQLLPSALPTSRLFRKSIG